MTITTPDSANKQKTKDNARLPNGAPASGGAAVTSNKAKRNNNKKKNRKWRKTSEAAAAAPVGANPARDVREDSTPIDTPASSGAATDVEGEMKPKEDGEPESKFSGEVPHELTEEPQSEIPQSEIPQPTKEPRNGPLAVNGEIGSRPSSAMAKSRKFDFNWADDDMEEDEETSRSDKVTESPAPAKDAQEYPVSEADNHAASETSGTCQAEGSPNHSPAPQEPEETARCVFERNGIYFGNNEESSDTTHSHTPGNSVNPGFAPNRPFPSHAPMPHGHPYPFVPTPPGIVPYPNHFQGPPCVPVSMPLACLPEQPAPYGPGLAHPYHPMYGMPHFPSMQQYSGQPWANDNRDRTCTPDTVYSANKASGANNDEHRNREEAADSKTTTAEGANQSSGTSQVVNVGTPVPPYASQVRPPLAETQVHRQILPMLEAEAEHDDNDPMPTHLLRIFKSGDFADYHLFLESTACRFYPIAHLVHGLLLSRSHFMAGRMRLIETYGYQKQLRASAGSSFVQPKAFEVALMNMYNLPLVDRILLGSQSFLSLGFECNPRNFGVDYPSTPMARMDFALCYAASGAFLGDKGILRRGIQLAVDEINWETIETAFRFGLDAASFAITSPDDVESDTGISRDGSTDGPPSDTPVPNPSYTSPFTFNWELVDVWAPMILHKSLEFVAGNLPTDLELDPGAQPTLMQDRFPEISGLSSTQIPSLKFGDFSKYSRETTTASAVLASLPFNHLRKLIKFMRSKGRLTPSLAETIVAERERRRTRAVRAYTSNPEYTDRPFPHSLGWEEAVQICEGEVSVKISLVKTWKGSHTGPMDFGVDAPRTS